MAPFIPQGLINPELNLLFALIIGFGFGYILEQAGFSSSRKLAGVFYGYDFVVLRVFFTAGITAMTGLVFMDYLGWIDMSFVYINPTYLWSAIIGGVIMGFGFILGGFCPGTSIVAAVIGKIDAMVFIAGAFIGIFIFGHFYDTFEPLYTGHFLGNPFIFETLGISKKWFVLFMAMMALVAFVITKIIEDKVNKVDHKQLNERPNYTMPAFFLLILVSIYLFLPAERKSSFQERSAKDLLAMYQSEKYHTDAIEAAYRIINDENDFTFIDVRDTISAAQFRLPGAIHIPLEDLYNRQWRSFMNNKEQKKVFYSNGESAAVKAWVMAARAGYENIYILKGGLNEFFNIFFGEEVPEPDICDIMKEFRAKFITDTKNFFQEGGAARKESSQPVPVKTMIEITVPAEGAGC